MKTKILSTIAVFAMIWGGGAVRYSPAQTRSETPVEHAKSGYQMNSPSDGAFHHRFEDAQKWAKEFDNPERDAWQKPEEILDVLHLQRTSVVADIGAGSTPTAHNARAVLPVRRLAWGALRRGWPLRFVDGPRDRLRG